MPSGQEAERLELALRGADLALWDQDLVTGITVVNARWFEMVGLPADRATSTHDQWAALIHPDDRDRVVALERAHIDGLAPAYEAQYRMRHADGRWIWVLDRGRVLKRDAQGRALRMVGTHLDISERVRAEEALREREQDLAVTLHSIGDAVVTTDAAGRVTRMNPAAERLTGWSAAESVGRPLEDVFRMVDARTGQPAGNPVQRVMATGQVIGLANGTVLMARDGTERQIADSAAPIRRADGQVIGVVLVFSDVTDAYRLQQALHERERELAQVAENVPGLVSRVDRDGRYRFANAAYVRWFDRPLSDILGRTQRELLGERRFRELEPLIRRALAGETVRYEHSVRMRDGERHVLGTLVPDLDAAGAVRGHFTFVTDISDQKRTEQALRAGEARTRALLDLLRSGVVVHDAGGRVLQANPAACAILGLDLAQLQGRSARDARWQFLDEQGQPLPPERFPVTLALASGAPVVDMIGAIQRPDLGHPVWVLGNAVPLRDAQDRIVEVVVTFADITPLKQAEDRLRHARADLAATLAAVPDLLFEIDLDGLILSHHSPRSDLLLMPASRQIGRHVADVLPEPAAGILMEALHEAHRTGFSGGRQYALDLPQGRHWFELSVSPKAAAPGEPPRFVMLARDVTDRRALEDRLREAQKLEALGTLAGGIAHDFNNVVAGILGHAAIALLALPPDHAAAPALQQIQRAGQRARGLVQQIMSFSHRAAPVTVVLDLRAVVDEAVALLRATAPPGVQMAIDTGSQPLPVLGDPTQLQQVLMNLCLNAWQALPAAGGRVQVRLEDHGAELFLTVQDDGIGMDEATRARIFDPFFTTKAAGQGTGLGLAVVHGIVRAHGGRIEVQSTPGAGSCFSVALPRAQAAPAAPARPAEAAAHAPGRGQHVVYVDDDEMLRHVARALLERAGWRVSTADNAAQALALVDRGDVDLLVSDLAMPEVSGLALCAEAARRRPGLPMLLCSGYATEVQAAEAAHHGVREVLAKERIVEDLVPAVARVWEGGS